jgi:hypothetical protein
MPLKKSQRSLKKWTEEKWTTPSGKKSSKTGEVYAPKAQIDRLKSSSKGKSKLAAANRKKEKPLLRANNTLDMVYTKEKKYNV